MPEKISTERLRSMPSIGLISNPSSNQSPEQRDKFLQIRLAKMRERRALLAQYPERRVNVDPAPLNEVLPHSAFVCYTGSSIKSNTAIKGSDIDGGIVITREPTTDDEQRRYIMELRKQGFKVYSPLHISKVEQAGWIDDEVLGDEGVTEMEQIRLKEIKFETYEEFEKQRLSGESLVHSRFFIIYADD